MQPHRQWPAEGVSRIPYWIYTDADLYAREQERIFCGPSWSYVALEAEIPKPGDFKRTFVGDKSVVVARGQDGELRFYDPIENVHQDGILAISRVPARIHADCAFEARRIAGKVAEALSHVGVLCVEMFEREGEAPRLVVNEIAPRVHNSGHWTLDGASVSQFDQHIRAIAGWPLATPVRRGRVEMINLLGAEVDEYRRWLDVPGAAVHLYGKASVRPGRKMGHVTRVYGE